MLGFQISKFQIGVRVCRWAMFSDFGFKNLEMCSRCGFDFKLKLVGVR